MQKERTQILLRIHWLSHWFFIRRLNIFSRFLDILIRLVYSARIPGGAHIGTGTHFSHNALAVLINHNAVIGEHCMIGTHVVLGGRVPHPGAPILEDYVVINAGAMVLGNVRVGSGSVIAANSVVIEDIPPGCLVAGIPATIKKRNIDLSLFR